ncbi:MAG: phosphohistidine phosphatase SixA [Betaproteobacteria bacterium]
MMQLVLWRHAEAEDYAASDLARPLTPKGRKQAQKMAAWLKGQADVGAKDWRIIASPAVRTQQTAEALGVPFETVPGIAPDVSAGAVLDAAHWPQGNANVVVVGHQPTLGMVAAQLMNGADGYVSIKKGAMWWFEMREKEGKRVSALKAMASPDMVG